MLNTGERHEPQYTVHSTHEFSPVAMCSNSTDCPQTGRVNCSRKSCAPVSASECSARNASVHEDSCGCAHCFGMRRISIYCICTLNLTVRIFFSRHHSSQPPNIDSSFPEMYRIEVANSTIEFILYIRCISMSENSVS